MKEIGEIGVVIETYEMGAKVSIIPQGSCNNCPASGFCNYIGKNKRIIEALNPINAKKGDKVKISISSKSALLSVFLVFVMPIVLTFLGIWIGSIFNTTFTQTIGGIGGFAMGMILLKIIDKKVKKSVKFKPTIVEIIEKGDTKN